jgi:hypothetical protein
MHEPHWVDQASEARGRYRTRMCRWSVVAFIALVIAAMTASVAVIRYVPPPSLRQVDAEIESVRRRGEPIEPGDLSTMCPMSAADAQRAEEWLRLAALAEPAGKFTDDVKPLPLIGESEVPDDALSQEDAVDLRAQTRAYLAKHGGAVRLAHELAKEEGPVQFPLKLEESFDALSPWAQSLRVLNRVLALELRLRAAEGDVEGACSSLKTMLAVCESMRPRDCGVTNGVVELVRSAMLVYAFRQAESLINRYQLSDDQLLGLQSRLLDLKPELDRKRVLLGERIMGWVAFQHPEQMLDDVVLGKSPRENVARRAKDCLLYLETMKSLIDICELPYLECSQRADAMVNVAIKRTRLPDGELNPEFAGSQSLLPGTLAFGISSRASLIASRDLLGLVIAAHRRTRKQGRLPRALDDLKPEFCSEIPMDPYSGKQYLLKTSDRGLVIYSVSVNGADDGGVNEQNTADIAFEVVAVESRGESIIP